VARRPAHGCELSDLFRVLGDAHVLDILHAALARSEPLRFNEIQTSLGISSSALADRLKRLVGAGLLLRQSFNEIPPRVEYTPSAQAIELKPVFETLKGWATRHELKPLSR
jgi:DNA-binding HxlR family transcriptional regulator